jgi:hypothetical protein
VSATDGHLRAGEVVVVRVTHSGGVHVHTAPSWRDAGRYIEGWATVTRVLEVTMEIEPVDGPVAKALGVGIPGG